MNWKVNKAMHPSDVGQCPYNKNHIMLRKHLQKHILKCRELYKDKVELLVCPFNKIHLISAADFQQHTKSCKDRKIILHSQFSGPSVIDKDTKHEKIEADENWDDSIQPAYNPQVYASQANIVREKWGLYTSQRKESIRHPRKKGDDKKSSSKYANTQKKTSKAKGDPL